MKKTFKITKDFHHKRLDKVLTILLEDISRAQIGTLLEKNAILVDDTAKKPAYKVKTGETITVKIEAKSHEPLKPVDMPLLIVYEDDDVMVINKPSGLVVHPSHTTKGETLVHGLLNHIDSANFEDPMRPGIVHRLDKDTSGLLLVAKTQESLNILQAALKERTIKREYHALVEGVIDHNRGKVIAPIGRHPKKRQQMSIIESGKEAITHFEVVKRFQDTTLIKCQLETGRTHQIRVHMQYIEHPILGDLTYGFKKHQETTGQYLHASKIAFLHPKTAKPLTFHAKLPTIFDEKLKSLS